MYLSQTFCLARVSQLISLKNGCFFTWTIIRNQKIEITLHIFVYYDFKTVTYLRGSFCSKSLIRIFSQQSGVEVYNR